MIRLNVNDAGMPSDAAASHWPTGIELMPPR